MLNVQKNVTNHWVKGDKTIYCIQVMFIGKTGYGKSTTLNKICGNEYFMTDEMESCTKNLYSCEYKLSQYNEYYLSMCDLPGIGESMETDKQYIQWYERMLHKSTCVVYVLRADQRDFSNDELFINTTLRKNGGIADKLIVGLNFADKIEPLSRINPFQPNIEQMNNLERKVESVSKLFCIKQKRIVFYSATDGYNLDKLKTKIATVLLGRNEN
jgi:small GTP-binding protein